MREVNVPQPTMHRLLKGKTDDIKFSTLNAIANFFSITIEELIRNEYSGATILPSTSLSCRNVPIITWKEVANFPCFESSDQREFVCTSAGYSDGTFAIKAKASFEPFFAKDTLFIVDPSVEPIDGDYVVVRYPGSSETTLRMLVLDGPISELKQISSAAKTDVMTEGTVIVGTVLLSMRILRKI